MGAAVRLPRGTEVQENRRLLCASAPSFKLAVAGKAGMHRGNERDDLLAAGALHQGVDILGIGAPARFPAAARRRSRSISFQQAI